MAKITHANNNVFHDMVFMTDDKGSHPGVRK